MYLQITIVDHDELVVVVRSVRVSVLLARHAVGGPTRVRNPDVDIQSLVHAKRCLS